MNMLFLEPMGDTRDPVTPENEGRSITKAS